MSGNRTSGGAHRVDALRPKRAKLIACLALAIIFVLPGIAAAEELLIIAPDEFMPALAPLETHKEATGIDTVRLSLESIYANYWFSRGVDEPEQIKLAIEHYHRDHGVRYVMLVGDSDKLPVRWVTYEEPNHPEIVNYYLPSDLYYADLYNASGGFDTWNYDGDEYFGEHLKSRSSGSDPYRVNADRADLHPDVAVGRVPASTVDEVELYVAKVIKYEFLTYADAPAADWFHAVLLIAGRGRACDPGIHYSDITTDLGSGFQYTTYLHSSYFTADPDAPCRPCNCTPGEPLADCMARTGLTADQLSVFEDADGFTDSPPRPDALFEDIGFLAWHDHGSSIGNYNTGINNANRFTVAFADGCSDGAFAGAPPGDMPRFAPTGQAGGQDLPYRTVDGHELNVEFLDCYLDTDGDGEDEKYYDITGCWVNGTYYPLAGDRCGGGWFPTMSFHDDFDSVGNLIERGSPYILNPPAPAPQQLAACDTESNPEGKLFATNTGTGEETGWIGMVGATMGTNFPVNGELESLFFKSYHHPHAQVGRNDTLGDLWWSMQEYWLEEIFDETGDFDLSDFFAKYDISEDDWFTVYCPLGVQTAMKFALFGDPSLRLGGIAGLEDTEPPETTFDEHGWYGGGEVIHVPLVAVDFGSPPSGVRETRYSVDNGSWRTAPVSFAALPDHRSDGVHQIDFFSIDYLENPEAERHATLNIDTYPPRTTVMLDGELPATTLCWVEDGEWQCGEHGCYGEDVTISFTAHDSPPPPTPTPAPTELWGRTFGGEEADRAYDFQQTLDGGFIMTGWTASFGRGSRDIWLIKTDTNGTEQWNRTFGGRGYDQGWAVLQTPDGGYLIAGATESYGAGSSDVWLLKTNSTGHELWNRTFGGPETDGAHAVVEALDGGYLVAGATQPFGSVSSDIWLMKTDSSGNEAWNKTFGGPASDDAYSLQQTADNGYIIVGDTASYGAGGSDVWLLKINVSGHELWNRTFGGLNADHGYSVHQTAGGGYIMAGYTDTYGAGSTDMWLIKADEMGNELWNRTFGGASFDLGFAVEETSDGGFILAGTITEWYDKNVWLIATNPTGTEEWRKKVGGSSWDEVSAVHQTSEGSYLLVGTTESYGAGDYDAWLVKIALTSPPPIAVSGIDRTEYSLNSGPWPNQEYTGPFEVHGGDLLDTRTLYYRSVDNASNEESYRSVSFCVSNWEMGRWRDEARILAALEEIVRFRMRQEIADILPIAAVEYAVAPRGYPDKMEVIGVDENGKDGWMVAWDTREVRNGDYLVRQTVRGFPFPGLLTEFSADPVIYQEEFNVTVCNIPNSSYRFELEADANEIDQGGSVQYTLTFHNKLENDLDNLNIICDTDIGSFKAITVEDNGNLTAEGLPSWFNKHLHTGETWTVHFKGRTKSDIRPGTVITSQALLTADTVPFLVSDDPSTKKVDEDYTAVTIKLINGTINGTVRDKEYGTPVAASVSLTGPVPQSVPTDPNGSYAFTNLPPGVYNLSVAADSYHAYSPEGPVTIYLNGLGERIQVDFLVARNDTIPPVSSLARSVDEIVRDNEQVLDGTAYDFSPGSGVRVVEVCIKRMNDRRFWNGSDWLENETWLRASGTTDWVFSCDGLGWDSTQAYALYSRATDYAGNVEIPSASTSTIALPAPRLITPVNGSIVHDLAFAWSYVAANSYYTLQVDDSPEFSSPEIDASSLLDETTFVPGELPERTYYWRVKAVDAFLGYPESAWSEVWRVTVSAGEAFDTGTGFYPSIAGTFNGTIRLNETTAVRKLYTYPCSGTGGHTKYVKIWNSMTGWNVTATWDGYTGDWHNLTFNNSFTLYANQTYNYTICTGSYPQIIHASSHNATNGVITCTSFVDVNGKRHEGWIPAIRLE